MNCPKCGNSGAKFGKTRDGQQRYRCKPCGKTYSEPKPLAGKATPMDKAALALKLLLEGMSIRATERLTGLHRDTIMGLMVQAGEQCQRFLAGTIQNHPFADIQIDEQWGFVGCKEKTAILKHYGPGCGDAYVYTAIDRDSKFLIAFHVGKRSSDDTWAFIDRLKDCVSGRPQITTDGWKPYVPAIQFNWNWEVDYAQVHKTYGQTDPMGPRRYSPAAIIDVERKPVCGNPNESRISTSHVERHNLSTRMHCRRMTRLTNAHSKKWENHEAMLALWYCWYNYCRKHQTLKTTPAVAAGLASEPWTLERLLTESAATAA